MLTMLKIALNDLKEIPKDKSNIELALAITKLEESIMWLEKSKGENYNAK